MNALPLAALAACILALPVPVAAQAPPSAGNFLGALVAKRLAAAPDSMGLLYDNARVRSSALSHPNFIYSPATPLVKRLVDPAWVDAWHFLEASGGAMTLHETESAFRWDLGLTKARPGIESPRQPMGMATDRLIGATVQKAGVSVDIFHKVGALVPASHDIVAAHVSVALQLLREDIAEAALTGQTYADLRPHVLARFLAAPSADHVPEEDLAYLMRLLENELSSWRTRSLSTYGYRQLPTALRIARMASAWHAMRPAGEADPCQDDGTYDDGVAALDRYDTRRRYCFNDMNDSDVYDDYVIRAREQRMTAMTDASLKSTPAFRFIEAVSRVRPAWIGVFDRSAEASAMDVDVVAAAIVQDWAALGVASPAQAAAQRAMAMDALCRRPPR